VKPNRFGGTSKENVDDWIFAIEQYFEISQLPEELKVGHAVSFLQGNAITWWRAQVVLLLRESNNFGQADQIISWSECKRKLIAQFKPVNAEKIARDKLRNLVQTSSVLKYINLFNTLCLDIPNLVEEDRLDKFLNGLKPDVQKEVEREEPKFLSDAMRIAQRIDQVNHRFNLKTKFVTTDNWKRKNESVIHNDPMQIDHIETVSRSKHHYRKRTAKSYHH
jgi:hypothetical protein